MTSSSRTINSVKNCHLYLGQIDDLRVREQADASGIIWEDGR
jgi:hypothetical protein